MTHTPTVVTQAADAWLDVPGVQAGTLAAGRPYQQDAFAYNENVWAVADGMGGHRDGEIAARIALETLCRHVESSVDEELLHAAFAAANDAVLALAEPGERRPPGSTLVAVARRSGGGLLLASTGDSRAYLIRPNGAWVQITDDHEDDAGRLTAYLGDPRSEGVHVDIHALPDGDGLNVLLCTDGLFGHLEPGELEELLEGGFEHLLVSAGRTSRDNVTALLLDLTHLRNVGTDR